MRGFDLSDTPSPLRGALAGIVAGVVASFVMDRFQAMAAAVMPDEDEGSEPATERAADGAAIAITGRAVPDENKLFAGQAVHYAVGAGLGLAYGIAAEYRPWLTTGCGTAFGGGVATLLDEGLVPAIGLGKAPWRAGWSSNFYAYASHLVFGATTEIVRRQARATLT